MRLKDDDQFTARDFVRGLKRRRDLARVMRIIGYEARSRIPADLLEPAPYPFEFFQPFRDQIRGKTVMQTDGRGSQSIVNVVFSVNIQSYFVEHFAVCAQRKRIFPVQTDDIFRADVALGREPEREFWAYQLRDLILPAYDRRAGLFAEFAVSKRQVLRISVKVKMIRIRIQHDRGVRSEFEKIRHVFAGFRHEKPLPADVHIAVLGILSAYMRRHSARAVFDRMRTHGGRGRFAVASRNGDDIFII